MENEYIIRRSIGVTSFIDKMRENKLRWFGHVMRKNKSEAVKSIIRMNAKERRGKEKPKRSKSDAIESDRRTTGVCANIVKDCI